MRTKWVRGRKEKYRGFLKIHVAVDTETGCVLAAEVTDWQSADCGQLKALVCGAASCGDGISTVLADGAYDSRDIFSFLDAMRVEAGIPVHKNSVAEANGDCPARMHAGSTPAPTTGGGMAQSMDKGGQSSRSSYSRGCSARPCGPGTGRTW